MKYARFQNLYSQRILSSAKKSSVQAIEISPYPHFLTYDTMEQFDLVLVFGLPLNRDAAEIVIHKSKSLIRHGGQVLLLNCVCILSLVDDGQKDDGLQELIKLLHSNIEDVPEYTRSISPRSLSKEEEEELSSQMCGEEIQSERDPDESPINEPTPTPKSENTNSFRDVDNKLPCDNQYVQNVLSDLNVS